MNPINLNALSRRLSSTHQLLRVIDGPGPRPVVAAQAGVPRARPPTRGRRG